MPFHLSLSESADPEDNGYRVRRVGNLLLLRDGPEVYRVSCIQGHDVIAVDKFDRPFDQTEGLLAVSHVFSHRDSAPGLNGQDGAVDYPPVVRGKEAPGNEAGGRKVDVLPFQFQNLQDCLP